MHARLVLALLGTLATAACGRTTDPPTDGGRRDINLFPDQSLETNSDAGVGDDANPAEDVGAADRGGRMCTMECPREVICCRGDCAGPIVYRGCCACLPNEVDSISCPASRQCQP